MGHAVSQPAHHEHFAAERRPPDALGNGKKKDKVLKGRGKVVPSIGKVVPPFQGFVRIQSATQRCVRASLALGWLVTGLWPESHTLGAPPRLNSKFRTASKVPVLLWIVPLAAFTHCASSPVVLINLKPKPYHIMSIPFTPIFANLMGPQAIFILFVLLLLFGAKKLPELAKGLGQAIREFSKAKNEIQDEIMREQPTPPARIETPVQTAAVPQPTGTQPTSAQQPAAPVQHADTHA